MSKRIKWIATRAAYAIDRVEQVQVSLPYRGTDGKLYPDHPVTGTKVTGYAGDVAVITSTAATVHPLALAGLREDMARMIQDAGGSWKGRSKESEDAKADRRVNYLPGETPAEYRARQDAYYSRVPHPSDY